MKRKKIWLSSLAVALLGLGTVHGQEYGVQSTPPGTTLPPPTLNIPGTLPSGPANTGMPLPGQEIRLSNYILGERSPGCCCPVGANGPLGYEMYMRSGVSLPVGGGTLNNSIGAGWDIEAGGRLLLFNKADDAAWTIDISITNVFNEASKSAPTVPLTNVPVKTTGATGAQTTTVVPVIDETPGDLNRTSLNLSGGREIWLLGTADSSHNDLNWRIGWDVGGRWGTEKLELNELQHRNAAFGGVFGSLHTDVEVPCGACILQAGLRLEFGYDMSQVLQVTHDGDVSDINLMATVGIRF